MEFRDSLKALRGELGITQVELATALHVNLSTVSRWELGKTLPSRAFVSAILDFASTQNASESSITAIHDSAKTAAKSRLELTADNLYAVEHASLCQLIDDAAFAIYVCDIDTDEVLYVNRKAEAIIGVGLDRLKNKRCYACLMHSNEPCKNCHKEEMREKGFISYEVLLTHDGKAYHVQGKLIRWNGHNAQARSITEVGNSVYVTAHRDLKTSYSEQIRLRNLSNGDIIASAHFNLTHNTVADLMCKREKIADWIMKCQIDDVLKALSQNTFTDGEQVKIESIGNRGALIQQFYMGRTHIGVKHYLQKYPGFYETVFDLIQNPTTYDIEAFATLRDITDVAMIADVADRLLGIDYETIATIDAETGKARPYIGEHIDAVIDEQKKQQNNEEGIKTFLLEHCADSDVERVIEQTSLPFVKRQLEKKKTHSVAYSLKQNGRIIQKRVLYTYLDKMQTTILCAMQDLTEYTESLKQRNSTFQ